MELQIENVQLRNEIDELQYEVAGLREWKERSISQFTKMAPQQNRMKKDKQMIEQVQRRIQKLQDSLRKRAELEDTNIELERKQEEMVNVVAKMELKWKDAERALSVERKKHVKTIEHKSLLLEMLEKHMDKVLELQRSCALMDDVMDIMKDENGDVTDHMTLEALMKRAMAKNKYDKGHEQFLGFMDVTKQLMSWFSEKMEMGGTFAMQQQGSPPKLDQVDASALQIAKEALEIERGVNAGLEALQIEKDMAYGTLTDTYQVLLKQHDKERTLNVRVRKNAMLYASLLQKEMRKKCGYIPDGGKLGSTWSTLEKDVAKANKSLQFP